MVRYMFLYKCLCSQINMEEVTPLVMCEWPKYPAHAILYYFDSNFVYYG